jgi:F-type H+-transporting ATPase subunit delta
MADTFDKQIEIADVYADALFSLAQEKGTINAVRAELEELAKVVELDPSFRAFMTSAALDDDHRAAALERIFRGKLSDEVLNTMLVMNRHGRNGLLEALIHGFVYRLNRAAGQVEVSVVSAVELDDASKTDVTRTAAELSGNKPVMSYKVDPDIIGGLIVQIGDVRYDNSVRSQLFQVRRRLLERSERGLPVKPEA